ncbi:MAG: very short patch repair endonuclease [Kiritimatiellia bacterium]|nr:very short patch repair endonuclease [Kiritimatiellia bacterium]
MRDPLTPEERSQRMSLVRGKDTKPEMYIRRLVHSMGYRYRLHVQDLPGSPDLLFPSRKKVIFVHGCFWHRHHCRMGNRMPKSRLDFWRPKLEGNKKRDIKHHRMLRRMGWRVLVIWECQTHPKKVEKLSARIICFLES